MTANIPSDVGDDLTAMQLFPDEALWAAAEPSLLPSDELRLIHLKAAAGERSLTPDEEAEQSELLLAYRRSVLRQAKAFSVLAQRGHQLPVTGINSVSNSE